MFTNISWSSYLLFVAFLLAAWYLFVGVRYYSAELQALASGKISFFPHKASPEEQPATGANGAADMEVLYSRLTGAIAAAAAKDFPKEEFIFLLQTVLRKFPQLGGSTYRADVHSLIAAECDRQSYIRLSDRDLELLWLA